MKEVEKKDAPEVSGGYVGPLVEDPAIVEPYPRVPMVPVNNPDDAPTTWR